MSRLLRMALLVLVTSGWTATTQLYSADEYAVKAGFLFRFVEFVTWPDTQQAGGVCRIAVDDPGGRAVSTIAEVLNGKTAAGRLIEVVSMERVGSREEVHILFVTRDAAPLAREMRDDLLRRNVLLVGETAEFARSHGVIGLTVRNDMPRLQINLEHAKRAGLVVSAKLSGVADIVRPRS
jgi:hypothetical protein